MSAITFYHFTSDYACGGNFESATLNEILVSAFSCKPLAVLISASGTSHDTAFCDLDSAVESSELAGLSSYSEEILLKFEIKQEISQSIEYLPSPKVDITLYHTQFT